MVPTRPPRVTSGEFGMLPVSFPVKVFLIQSTSVCVRDDLSEWELELQNPHGESVSDRLTLRRVRDMPGLGADPDYDRQDELLCDLESELKECLEIFDPDIDTRMAPDPEIFLKALVHYILNKFELDGLEAALAFYHLNVEEKRTEEAHQWNHLLY